MCIIFCLTLNHLFKFVSLNLSQDIKITLQTVSGEGTLGLRREFTLSILPNDNPHGMVQFAQSMYTVQEADVDSVQLVPLTRL